MLSNTLDDAFQYFVLCHLQFKQFYLKKIKKILIEQVNLLKKVMHFRGNQIIKDDFRENA